MKGSATPIRITADTQVYLDKTEIDSVILTAGSDLATLTIYDEADNSETATEKALTLKAPTNTSEEKHGSFLLKNGCYVTITGTSAEAFIYVK